jgi:hypothetical protein
LYRDKVVIVFGCVFVPLQSFLNVFKMENRKPRKFAKTSACLKTTFGRVSTCLNLVEFSLWTNVATFPASL